MAKETPQQYKNAPATLLRTASVPEGQHALLDSNQPTIAGTPDQALSIALFVQSHPETPASQLAQLMFD
ncbi:MAG: hypothetical protein WC525_09140 [Candidatus Thermoplasmatota archaeon]